MVHLSGLFDLVESGHPSQLKFILQRPDGNFNVNAVNDFGQTPLMVAATRKSRLSEQFIDTLIYNGGNYLAKDVFKRDLLFYCVIFGQDAMAAKLVSTGEFNLQDRDVEGRTVLFHAVCLNRPSVVETIVNWTIIHRKQDLLSIADNRGSTPLSQAIYFSHDECSALLKRANVQMNEEQGGKSYSVSFPQETIKRLKTIDPALSSRKIRSSTPGCDYPTISRSYTPRERPTTKGRSYTPREPNIRRGQNCRDSLRLLLDMQALHTSPYVLASVAKPKVEEPDKINTRKRDKRKQSEVKVPEVKADLTMDAYEITKQRIKEDKLKEAQKAAEAAKNALLPPERGGRRGSVLSIPTSPQRKSRRGSILLPGSRRGSIVPPGSRRGSIVPPE